MSGQHDHRARSSDERSVQAAVEAAAGDSGRLDFGVNFSFSRTDGGFSVRVYEQRTVEIRFMPSAGRGDPFKLSPWLEASQHDPIPRLQHQGS